MIARPLARSASAEPQAELAGKARDDGAQQALVGRDDEMQRGAARHGALEAIGDRGARRAVFDAVQDVRAVRDILVERATRHRGRLQRAIAGAPDLPVKSGQRHRIARIGQRPRQAGVTRRVEDGQFCQLADMNLQLFMILLFDMAAEQPHRRKPQRADAQRHPDQDGGQKARAQAGKESGHKSSR
jgi:hypothetical protein